MMASVSHAAILEAWLTSDNMSPAANAAFKLTIWLQIVPDPAINPPDEMSQFGIANVMVSIYQQNPVGNCAPVPRGTSGMPKTQVQTTWNTDAFDYGNYAPAIISSDGYDGLNAGSVTSDNDMNVGATAPVWFCTETWQEAAVQGSTTFHPAIDPSAVLRYHRSPIPFVDYVSPTGFQTTDLVINAPEPGTLALLALGGIGVLRKRRRSQRRQSYSPHYPTHSRKETIMSKEFRALNRAVAGDGSGQTIAVIEASYSRWGEPIG